MKNILAGLTGLALLTTFLAFGSQDGRTMPQRPAQSGGLRASILLKGSTRNQQPYFREAGPDELFYSGDQFRLRLRSTLGGYCYILLHSSEGENQLLFPEQEEIQRGDYRLKPNQNATFPRGSSFRLDNEEGTERLWIVLSEQPIPELEAIASGDDEMSPTLFKQFTSPDFTSSKGVMRSDDNPAPGGDGRVIILPIRMNHLSR